MFGPLATCCVEWQGGGWAAALWSFRSMSSRAPITGKQAGQDGSKPAISITGIGAGRCNCYLLTNAGTLSDPNLLDGPWDLTILASCRGRDTDCARWMFQVKTLYTGIAWFSWPWPAACAVAGPACGRKPPGRVLARRGFQSGADNNVGNGVAAEYLSWC